ncbi:hypothetical protein H6P81_015837 [Aristolochia fimbriata]|uniref:Uncharacterized protein n=1 Tax=Aristolochia fimbriata TaxID=158543 RepID=A0AAV7E9S7_ARIFI|nr:hypothetical protein H6P81_015837 [Aristolochia fimbriata]
MLEAAWFLEAGVGARSRRVALKQAMSRNSLAKQACVKAGVMQAKAKKVCARSRLMRCESRRVALEAGDGTKASDVALESKRVAGSGVSLESKRVCGKRTISAGRRRCLWKQASVESKRVWKMACRWKQASVDRRVCRKSGV